MFSAMTDEEKEAEFGAVLLPESKKVIDGIIGCHVGPYESEVNLLRAVLSRFDIDAAPITLVNQVVAYSIDRHKKNLRNHKQYIRRLAKSEAQQGIVRVGA